MKERLQKLIASAGIASRRHAEEMIAAGQVSVNGKIIREPGTKADPQVDHIKVKGRLINQALERRENIYVLLNKPRGYLTSASDPEGRPLVMDLLPRTLGRLHAVGRLDFNTEGLLLLTNDGEFTNLITAAKNRIPKVYEAKVKGMPPESAVERLRRGIEIGDDERTAPAEVRRMRETKTNSRFEVLLHEGRNQQIRRMFDAIGHSVIKLRRVRIGTLEDKWLEPGRWRLLTDVEVRRLKHVRKPTKSSPAVPKDGGAVKRPKSKKATRKG